MGRETIMNGAHPIERSYEVTLETLHEVFRELHRQRMALEGMLLKTNMVVTDYEPRTAPASISRDVPAGACRGKPAKPDLGVDTRAGQGSAAQPARSR